MSFLCNFFHKYKVEPTSGDQIVSFGVPGISRSIARQTGIRTCERCNKRDRVVKHGDYNTLVDKYLETNYGFIGDPAWRPIDNNTEEEYWQEHYADCVWNGVDK